MTFNMPNSKVMTIIFSLIFICLACNYNSISSMHGAKLPTVNIQKNDKLVSPTKVEVNSQGIWFASEGSLGFVKLIDEKGTELARGFLTTQADWMTSKPVLFSTELIFNAKDSVNGMLIIHNDPGPGSGDEAGEQISFTIPITFQ